MGSSYSTAVLGRHGRDVYPTRDGQVENKTPPPPPPPAGLPLNTNPSTLLLEATKTAQNTLLTTRDPTKKPTITPANLKTAYTLGREAEARHPGLGEKLIRSGVCHPNGGVW